MTGRQWEPADGFKGRGEVYLWHPAEPDMIFGARRPSGPNDYGYDKRWGWVILSEELSPRDFPLRRDVEQIA